MARCSGTTALASTYVSRPAAFAAYSASSAASSTSAPVSAWRGKTATPIDTVTGSSRSAAPRIRSTADAGAYRERPVAHGLADPPGRGETARDVGLRQQDHELLAALPEREVDLPDDAADPLRELDQHGVAGAVPVPVVDLLEVVQVEDEDAERAAEPAGPFDLQAQRSLRWRTLPSPVSASVTDSRWVSCISAISRSSPRPSRPVSSRPANPRPRVEIAGGDPFDRARAGSPAAGRRKPGQPPAQQPPAIRRRRSAATASSDREAAAPAPAEPWPSGSGERYGRSRSAASRVPPVARPTGEQGDRHAGRGRELAQEVGVERLTAYAYPVEPAVPAPRISARAASPWVAGPGGQAGRVGASASHSAHGPRRASGVTASGSPATAACSASALGGGRPGCGTHARRPSGTARADRRALRVRARRGPGSAPASTAAPSTAGPSRTTKNAAASRARNVTGTLPARHILRMRCDAELTNRAKRREGHGQAEVAVNVEKSGKPADVLAARRAMSERTTGRRPGADRRRGAICSSRIDVAAYRADARRARRRDLLDALAAVTERAPAGAAARPGPGLGPVRRPGRAAAPPAGGPLLREPGGARLGPDGDRGRRPVLVPALAVDRAGRTGSAAAAAPSTGRWPGWPRTPPVVALLYDGELRDAPARRAARPPGHRGAHPIRAIRDRSACR